MNAYLASALVVEVPITFPIVRISVHQARGIATVTLVGAINARTMSHFVRSDMPHHLGFGVLIAWIDRNLIINW